MNDWLKEYPSDVPHEINESELISIAEMIEKTTKIYANNKALTCFGSSITFKQLNYYADRFAGFLQHEIGLKRGDRLAIMLPNIIQFPVVFFAAQKIGVVCVATNPLYTPHEMKYQFEDSGVVAIIILDLFLDKLEKILDKTRIKTIISASLPDHLPVWKAFFFRCVLKLKGMVPKHSLSVTKYKDIIFN